MFIRLSVYLADFTNPLPNTPIIYSIWQLVLKSAKYADSNKKYKISEYLATLAKIAHFWQFAYLAEHIYTTGDIVYLQKWPFIYIESTII